MNVMLCDNCRRELPQARIKMGSGSARVTLPSYPVSANPEVRGVTLTIYSSITREVKCEPEPVEVCQYCLFGYLTTWMSNTLWREPDERQALAEKLAGNPEAEAEEAQV